MELGHIEAALHHHPGVKECVVALRRVGPWNGGIVAFFETRGSAHVSSAALSEFMTARVPDFMLPVAYVEAAADCWGQS